MLRRGLPLACVLGLALLPAGAQAKPAIVGGQDAEVRTVPYQVALLSTTGSSTFNQQFCGGTILDATHVATAAHCVTEEDGTVTSPGAIRVLAGATSLSEGDLDPLPDGVQRVAVAAVSRNAAYTPGPEVNDAALLTLATPLTYSDRVQQIALAGTSPASGTLLISGWGCTTQYTVSGCTSSREYPDRLRSTEVDVVPDTTCQLSYPSLDATTMLCAARAGRDTCQGDSGGPAVSVGTPGDLSTYRLVGITSYGDGCAGTAPGVYAEVAAATVRSVLVRPVLLADPTISQTGPRAGATVTCDPGSWSGSPTFTYRFERADGSEARAVSGAPTYVRSEADATQPLHCTVIATTAADTVSARSSGDVPSEATTSVVPPVPTEPVTASPSPPPVAPVPVADTTRPRAKVSSGAARLRVSRQGRFSLTLAAPGERALVAATATAVKRVKGRLLTLGKVRRSGVAAAAPVTVSFTLKAADRRRLRAARRLLVRVSITVTDDAGNRATVARRVTLITP